MALTIAQSCRAASANDQIRVAVTGCGHGNLLAEALESVRETDVEVAAGA